MRDRKPYPNNHQAEVNILAIMLKEPTDTCPVAERFLRPSDFFSEVHATIFKSIIDVYRSGKTPDLVSVYDDLEKKGQIDEVGPSRLSSIEDSSFVLSAKNFETWLDMVKSKSWLRTVINSAETLRNAAVNEIDDFEEVRELILNELDNISDIRGIGEIPSERQIAKDFYKYLERLVNGEKPASITTGFNSLDYLANGFPYEELTLIAARPAMGKTSFITQVASKVANKGKKVLFFSVEMSNDQLMARLLSDASGVNYKRFQEGKMRDDEFRACMIAIERLQRENLWIDDRTMWFEDMTSKILSMNRKHGIDLVVIDYIQLVKVRNRRAAGISKREEEVSHVSSGLKAIAKKIKRPIVALSQLNRDVEKRKDKRPQLSDLRESGSLEQDAALILMMYREAYYLNNGKDEVEIGVRKNRFGNTGDITLRAVLSTQTWSDI